MRVQTLKKKIMNILLFLVLLYLGVLAALYIMQRSIIYYPDRSRPADVAGVERVSVRTSDDLTLEGFYLPPSNADKPVIVFFHGNAGHYGHRLFKASILNESGYGVLLAEYRGYGGNPGAISEDGFYRDGRAFIDWLQGERGVSSDQLVLYGESIGSGTATQMAIEYDIAALVLEVPFSSLYDVAKRQYFFLPVKYLLKDKFFNDRKISRINAPLLIVYSQGDRIIPAYSTLKLYDAAIAPKNIKNFPQANHNDLYVHGAGAFILDFIAGVSEDKADTNE